MPILPLENPGDNSAEWNRLFFCEMMNKYRTYEAAFTPHSLSLEFYESGKSFGVKYYPDLTERFLSVRDPRKN